MAGVALGILGAALGSRALTGVLYMVDPRDLPAYLAVAVVMAGTGLMAAWIPAARAGRVDPATTLREEG
jgi:putative ABC transport system permease protein